MGIKEQGCEWRMKKVSVKALLSGLGLMKDSSAA